MKIIGKIAKIERINIITMVIAILAFYVFAMGIACIRMNMEHEFPCYIPMGTIAALMMAVIMQIMIRVIVFPKNYNLAVSMGITRREFLIGYQLYNLLEFVIVIFGVWVLYLIEGVVAKVCFSNEPMAEYMDIIFQIKFIVPVLLVLCCLEIFVEAVTMRFGAKAWWTLWAFWMAMCLGGPKLLVKGVKGMLPAGMQKLGSLLVAGGPVLWVSCSAVFLVVLLIVSWNIMKKQQVTA